MFSITSWHRYSVQANACMVISCVNMLSFSEVFFLSIDLTGSLQCVWFFFFFKWGAISRLLLDNSWFSSDKLIHRDFWFFSSLIYKMGRGCSVVLLVLSNLYCQLICQQYSRKLLAFTFRCLRGEFWNGYILWTCMCLWVVPQKWILSLESTFPFCVFVKESSL